MEHQEIFLGARKIFGECSKLFGLVGGGGGCLRSKIKFCCEDVMLCDVFGEGREIWYVDITNNTVTSLVNIFHMIRFWPIIGGWKCTDLDL